MKSIVVIVLSVLFTFFLAYQSYNFGQSVEQERVAKSINQNKPPTEVEKYNTMPIALAIIVPSLFWFGLGFSLYLYDSYRERRDSNRFKD